jgi:hypothetical protein
MPAAAAWRTVTDTECTVIADSAFAAASQLLVFGIQGATTRLQWSNQHGG